ncbi:hypothetical protein WMY93_026395 [Mugilogobius chulae]|uniref:Uncharacterized protein n=1 Tax=Mugilogobius chulae TaxID=88201 RepID=A0AAW0N0T1_9GOBI
MSSYSELNQKYNVVQETVKEQTERSHELQEQVCKLQRENEEKNQRERELQRDLREQQKTIEFMEKIGAENEAERETVKEDLIQKEEQNRQLSTTVKELQQQLTEAKATIKIMEKTEADSQAEKERMEDCFVEVLDMKEKEKRELEASLEELDKALCEKEMDHIQQLRKIDDKIQADEQKIEKVLDQKEQENMKLSATVKELQQQLIEQKMAMEKIEADNQAEKEKMKEDLKQKEEQNNELSTSLGDLKQDLREAKRTIKFMEKIEADNQAQKEIMEEELSQKDEKNRQLSTTVKEMQQQLTEAKMKLEKNESDNLIEKQKMAALQSELDKKEQENKEISTSLEKVKQELEEQKTTAEKIEANIQADKEQMKEELELKEKKNKQLEENIKNLQGTVKKYMKEQVKQFQRELDLKDEEKQQLQRKNEELEKIIGETVRGEASNGNQQNESLNDSIGEEDGDHSLNHNNNNSPSDGDLLLIRITPDHEGKFGFNVKGGVDQKMPLAISHVKPDSPAGKCEPKLLEGDLVVLINGRDISEHTHDQVVMFIRASRESHSRELALLVKRKGAARVLPQLQLPPTLTLTGLSQGNKPHSPVQSEAVTTLEESMRQLERAIQSGTLCFHFENLYKRNPGLSLNCARLSENMEKNRYRDVLPYDDTRVVPQGQEDYINASHITSVFVAGAPPMSGVCLRYVAAQGPLVWEQKAHTVIMLTTLTERGRTKCHQYWPHPPQVKSYGHMQVKCHSEECNLAYVTRQFTLTNTKLGEERAVTHLQYVAWPDHGVPDDPSDFLLFVTSVRSDAEETSRSCAGIGRTGVLITMETGLALLDQGRPVFPLEIVKTLRDQRAMMVQTTCQFQFVCEAILRVYKEKKEGSSAPVKS